MASATFIRTTGRTIATLAMLALAGAILAGPAVAAGKKAASTKAETPKALTPQDMLGMEVFAADSQHLGQVMARRIGTTEYDLVLRLDDEAQIPQLISDGIVARPSGPGASVTTPFGPETVAVPSKLMRRADKESGQLIVHRPALTAMR